MHEQSIVESILSLALENAEKAQAKRVLKIYLVVGELSGVVDEAVEFYFNFLSRDTIAAQANLSFRHVPMQLRCRNCNTIFTPEKLDLHCPKCKEQQVEIVSGRELYIESLEVD
jgi:hydrogenase nickel incorporation protein HypA/HybF